jgi:hypothetical protein
VIESTSWPGQAACALPAVTRPRERAGTDTLNWADVEPSRSAAPVVGGSEDGLPASVIEWQRQVL